MKLFKFFKKTLLNENSIICLVDEKNSTSTFGYTESKKKVMFNIKMLEGVLNKLEFDELLSNSKAGLTTLFPIGQYIVILKMRKDKTEMQLFFFDFRVKYSDIANVFDSIFSNTINTEFKNIKSEMDDYFNESLDNIVQLKIR